MKRIIFLAAVMLLTISLRSQNESKVWVFANNSGLDFNGSTVTALNNSPIMYAFSTACYCDAEGKMLLYSDGMKIWNGRNEVISGGESLDGDIGCSQSSLIVPDPSRKDSYYVFAVDKLYGNELLDKGLSYSRVDMSKNGGKGNVEIANVQLLEKTPEKITAVRHANGIDYWVITHGWESNSFYVYPVTQEDGLHADNPKIINVGSNHSSQYSKQGYLKVSQDGRYLVSVQWEGVVELFSFNTETGNITLESTGNIPNAYGAEFSLNGKQLYLSTSPSRQSADESTIQQIDLTAANPFSSPVIIAHSSDTSFASLQMGPDRRIYCAQYITTIDALEHMAIIHNPDRRGAECNFNLLDNTYDAGIPLGGKKLIAGLPNFVSSYLVQSYFTYDSICYNNVVSFDIRNKDNIDAVSWDFGDPTSGAANSSTDLTAMHVFSAPGTYTVTVESTFNGKSYIYSQPVVVNPLPEIDFGSDTIYLFPGAIAPLEIAEGYTSYEWNTGSTGNLYLANEPGEYHVVVTDNLGCINSKTVMILSANIYFPNAFTPNSDGLNDVFTPEGANSGLYNIRMFVYNRMGQLMYESPVLAELGDAVGNFGWDGNKNGVLQPTGSYVWIVKFDVEKEKGQFNTEHYSGNVMLLR